MMNGPSCDTGITIGVARWPTSFAVNVTSPPMVDSMRRPLMASISSWMERGRLCCALTTWINCATWLCRFWIAALWVRSAAACGSGGILSPRDRGAPDLGRGGHAEEASTVATRKLWRGLPRLGRPSREGRSKLENPRGLLHVAGLQTVEHEHDVLDVVGGAAVEAVERRGRADREEVRLGGEVLADGHDDRTRELEDRRLLRGAVVEHGRRRVEAPDAAAGGEVPARRLEHRLGADGQRPEQLGHDAQVVVPAVGAVEEQEAPDRQDHVGLIRRELAGGLEVGQREVADVRVAEQLRAVDDRRGRIAGRADEGVPQRLVEPLAVSMETRHRGVLGLYV